MKNNFRSQFTDRVRKNSHRGNRVRKTYQGQYDKDGRLELVEAGQEDLYDFIQSHAHSCDIHTILNRYKNGELDVLSRRQGTFMDSTQMPKTYAELLNVVIAEENKFNSLPVEVRAKFEHSFGVYMSQYASPEWFDKLGIERKRAESDELGSIAPKEGESDA